MKHLVFLDTHAGELENILTGMKTMLVKELDPAQNCEPLVSPGDSLYFLRDTGDCSVRVKATVVRVLYCTDRPAGDLALVLKEMQPKLQLTEAQYNDWSARRQVSLVEFGAAHKIVPIHVEPAGGATRPAWIAFEELSQIA